MEVLQRANALRGEIDSESWSQGGGLASLMDSITPSTHQHRPPVKASGPGCSPNLIFCSASIWPWSTICSEHQFPHLALLLEQGALLLFRVRCACSPPVCCTEPTCSWTRGRAMRLCRRIS